MTPKERLARTVKPGLEVKWRQQPKAFMDLLRSFRFIAFTRSFGTPVFVGTLTSKAASLSR